MDKKDVVRIHNGILFNSHEKGEHPSICDIMDLEHIFLNEISQTEKDKYCMISLICEILKSSTC